MLSPIPSTKPRLKLCFESSLGLMAVPSFVLSLERTAKPRRHLGAWLGQLSLSSWTFRRKLTCHTLIGIDFGDQYIHAVALSYGTCSAQQPPCYQLQAMVRVAVPNGAICDHQFQNRPQLVEVLRQLRRLLKMRSNQVATAVSGSGVTTKILYVPHSLPAEMFAHHVQQAAMAQLPFPLAEVYWDFEILKPSAEHPDRDKVLLSAARIEQVQARVEVLHQAGWHTQVVDIGSHALARAVCFLLAPLAEQAVGVFELNSDSLSFMVITDGDIVYQRLQPFIASAEAVSTQHYLAQITSQAERHLQWFASHSGHVAPSSLMLFGSTASTPLPLPPHPQLTLPQLADSLSAQLGMSIQIADFNKVFGESAKLHPDAAAFGTALGLALRRVSHV